MKEMDMKMLVIVVHIDSPTSFIYIASVIFVMDPLLDQSSSYQCPRPAAVTEVKLPVMQLGVNSTFLIHLRLRNVHYIYPL